MALFGMRFEYDQLHYRQLRTHFQHFYALLAHNGKDSQQISDDNIKNDRNSLQKRPFCLTNLKD